MSKQCTVHKSVQLATVLVPLSYCPVYLGIFILVIVILVLYFLVLFVNLFSLILSIVLAGGLIGSAFWVSQESSYIYWVESTWSGITSCNVWRSSTHVILPPSLLIHVLNTLDCQSVFPSISHELSGHRIWDLSLERDAEEEAEFRAKMKEQANAPEDLPPQLLFVHQVVLLTCSLIWSWWDSKLTLWPHL